MYFITDEKTGKYLLLNKEGKEKLWFFIKLKIKPLQCFIFIFVLMRYLPVDDDEARIHRGDPEKKCIRI